MDVLVSFPIECPHCGEAQVVQIDTLQGNHATIEDCTVCCAPMQLDVRCSAGSVDSVEVTPG